MEDMFHLLDVVALTEAVAENGLRRGQVGTIVELLEPGVFEVEFSDDAGRAYAIVPFSAEQLIALHFQPMPIA